MVIASLGIDKFETSKEALNYSMAFRVFYTKWFLSICPSGKPWCTKLPVSMVGGGSRYLLELVEVLASWSKHHNYEKNLKMNHPCTMFSLELELRDALSQCQLILLMNPPLNANSSMLLEFIECAIMASNIVASLSCLCIKMLRLSFWSL